MNKTYSLFIVFAASMMLSCGDNKDIVRYERLDSALNQAFDKKTLNQSSHFIIVPRVGCGGCIENATAFVKNNIDSLKNVKIVFTAISDFKMLRIEVGEQFLHRPQVYIDTSDLFRNAEIKSVYPQLVSLKNGKAISVQELDVNSPIRTLLN